MYRQTITEQLIISLTEVRINEMHLLEKFFYLFQTISIFFTDYRLHPSLAKSCRLDIPKFCKDVVNSADHGNNVEYEGKVVNCLKIQFLKKVDVVSVVSKSVFRLLIKKSSGIKLML